jgi:carboxymethylenebutenolidase
MTKVTEKEINKIEHDVKEYPDAGHSFLDDYKGLMGVLGVLIGASHKDEDAANARTRIRAFFAGHLASDTAHTDQKETNE